MIDLERIYFEWLLTCLEPDGVTGETVDVCNLLHHRQFRRRIGNDINRAVDGVELRKEFLRDFDASNIDDNLLNYFMMADCTWFEMLVALSQALDYLYDGGVEGRFLELLENLGLESLLRFGHIPDEEDQHLVDAVTQIVDNNEFDEDGQGGLFPLEKDGHPDQREVEIWDQHAAYFREKLEGVLWTSTN